MEALTHALEIASIPEGEEVLFQAADLMDQDGLTAFDAYHVAFADTDPVLSSDQAFEKVDHVDRIPLESTDGRE